MASPIVLHRTSTVQAFSLIEILVVLGMLVVIGGMTAFVGFDSYRVGALGGEERTLVSVLQKARAESMNNIDQIQHGVAIFPAAHPTSYVVFEGASYAAVADHTKDEVVASNYPVTITPGNLEVVFDQLSGDANYNGDIVLVDPVRGMSRTISINYEGRISW